LIPLKRSPELAIMAEEKAKPMDPSVATVSSAVAVDRFWRVDKSKLEPELAGVVLAMVIAAARAARAAEGQRTDCRALFPALRHPAHFCPPGQEEGNSRDARRKMLRGFWV
jgi:hypothetical protein